MAQRGGEEAGGQARAFFENAPHDPPSKKFVERCKVLQENPPPANWGGVWDLTSK